MKSTLILRLLVPAFALALAVPAAAQPTPPQLPGNADPNDWQAYMAAGDRQFQNSPTGAREAYYWASRLDPSRAEPLFARWAVFYASDVETFLGYLNGDPAVWQRPEVRENEQHFARAFRRNPFVNRGLETVLYIMLTDRVDFGPLMRPLVAYTEGNFDAASAGFRSVIRSDPRANLGLRQWRALAFVGGGQMDSAQVEITRLLESLRERDQTRMQYAYESKAGWEYAIGLLQEAQNRPAEARARYEAALVEDLSMYTARAGLARLAMQEGRTEEAVEHLRQAVEIAPDDVVMRLEYGKALLAVGQFPPAVAELRKVVEAEPYWAEGHLNLAVALHNAGDLPNAIIAYQGYLSRAPRRQVEAIQQVRARVAELERQQGS